MKILITGGAGFIGSHLARHLMDLGHHVHVLDDLSTGRFKNIAVLVDRGCVFQEQKVGDALESVNWVQPFDCIYHLAAAVGVQLVVDEPVRTIETNVTETTAVLRAATAFHIPVLVASTSEVYGKSERVPFREDDDVTYGATIYSRWSYAATKAIDEYLALAYHAQRKMPVVIARFFNTVGPGQIGTYGMVIPRFVKAALTGEPLRIYGDGQQARCFCHVADVVEALPKLMDQKACYGRVFNIGAEEEITIDALADRVIALSGSTSQKEFIPYEAAYGARFDDLRRRVPDLTRIREAVGFRPSRTLDQILMELIELERFRATV